MNFYPIPPTITAELYLQIPEEKRCTGEKTDWRSGVSTMQPYIFLEGPVADDQGNLFVVDIPHGRILKITPEREVIECGRWNGEPNGLAPTADGFLLVADYKEVSASILKPFD